MPLIPEWRHVKVGMLEAGAPTTAPGSPSRDPLPDPLRGWIWMRSRLANLMLLLGSTLLGLVLAELITLGLEPDSLRTLPETFDEFRFFQFDRRLGWSPIPNLRGRHKGPDFDYPVSHNQEGMRDRDEIPRRKADPDRLRIAFLGDSFVWGFGVAAEHRFTDLLGRHPRIEPLNFGVSAYGPVQYLLMLDRVLEFHPDLVIIGFTFCNDFSDALLDQG